MYGTYSTTTICMVQSWKWHIKCVARSATFINRDQNYSFCIFLVIFIAHHKFWCHFASQNVEWFLTQKLMPQSFDGRMTAEESARTKRLDEVKLSSYRPWCTRMLDCSNWLVCRHIQRKGKERKTSTVSVAWIKKRTASTSDRDHTWIWVAVLRILVSSVWSGFPRWCWSFIRRKPVHTSQHAIMIGHPPTSLRAPKRSSVRDRQQNKYIQLLASTEVCFVAGCLS